MTTTIAETRQVIIGTAGHIDHGKTALVKALTGTDADTLAEEKRRGITIELGFVFMDEPGLDKQIVFIDVPGHEKLIKTMVAGASNIDAALLVIAADDGISAQTVEHFDILQLLGIETGVIALTKADLVDRERIQQVTEQIRASVAGTFMSDAPVIPVSSLAGVGVDEIRSALISVAQKVGERQDSGVFRMPIDRVFIMRGFGVVIAGTVLSGQIGIGDKIEILPDGLVVKVRGIQIHNQSTQGSFIGRRTAINLQDVKKEELRRGQCAGMPGSLSPTMRLDARLYLLKTAGKELKNRSRLRMHIGTDEVICRVVLLDREKLLPGETAPVQFVLESPTVALPKDRFIIRTFSPLMTIGGGQILDAAPSKHKRSDPQVIEGLEKLEGDLIASVEQVFLKAGSGPQRPTDVALSLGAREDEVNKAITQLRDVGKLVEIAAGTSARGAGAASQGKYLHASSYSELADRLTNCIKDYFDRNPYRLLMPLSDLQSRFLRIADRQTFESIVNDLSRKGKVHRKEAKIGLVGYEIALKPDEGRLADQLERAFKDAGFAPPLEEDVRKGIGTPPSMFENLMTCLIEQGGLVRLSDKVTYHKEPLQKVRDIVARYLRTNPGLTVGELRDRLRVSRKYALALLEYFDTIGFTKREGDNHVLR